MNIIELKELIDRYYENELDKTEELTLFTELAVNEEGREYFKVVNLIKSSIIADLSDFPEELDERILTVIGSTEQEEISKFSGSYLQVFSYAAAIVILIVSAFLYSEFTAYKSELQILDAKLKKQNQTIEMLYNSYPVITVKPSLNQ
ncbi:MAG: hypothetical protein IAE91_08365 [Ignavibacteriaceae bacterium]|nr:hypothetical protein [Ignavibacteriaceae bacterium]